MVHTPWRVLLKSLAFLTAAAGLVTVTCEPAQANGAGRACIFLQPNGASVDPIGFGHVGWGFRVAADDDRWFFGSTENTQGLAFVWAKADNGMWYREGSFRTMLDTFVRQSAYPRNYRQYPAAVYTEYRCKTVYDSDVTAAKQAMLGVLDAGYMVWGNNCMDHAWAVLAAYGTTDLGDRMGINVGPNSWYSSLHTSWGDSIELPAETWGNPTTGKYIDVYGASKLDGAPIDQWSWLNVPEQWWWRIDAGGGYFKLVSRRSHKCVDVAWPGTANGALAHQWQCFDTHSQLWRWESAGTYHDGYLVYQIRNKHSGKCLAIENLSTADGARLLQWDCDGGWNQKWTSSESA